MKTEDFAQLMQGVGELVRHRQGKTVKGLRVSEVQSAKTAQSAELDIKQLRESAKVTQSEFARLIGVNVNTLQNWEQCRNKPSGAANALLWLVARNPRQALRTLATVPV